LRSKGQRSRSRRDEVWWNNHFGRHFLTCLRNVSTCFHETCHREAYMTLMTCSRSRVKRSRSQKTFSRNALFLRHTQSFSVFFRRFYFFTFNIWTLCSGITGGADRPGWHPNEKKLWVNLQRIVDKRGRIGEKGAGWYPLGGDTRVKSIKVTLIQ